MTNSEDSAFPVRSNPKDPNSEMGGLTKREYFAGFAMQGIISYGEIPKDLIGNKAREWLANTSCLIADALINELNKPKESSK